MPLPLTMILIRTMPNSKCKSVIASVGRILEAFMALQAVNTIKQWQSLAWGLMTPAEAL
jgi:hypothetical protein